MSERTKAVSPSNDRLLKVSEAMQRLGIGQSKLFELLRAGSLRSVRIGGARRVRETDLIAFIQSLSDGGSN